MEEEGSSLAGGLETHTHSLNSVPLSLSFFLSLFLSSFLLTRLLAFSTSPIS